MLKSSFFLCEGVQNASFLKVNFLFCEGIQGDICFSWAVAKNNFYHMISPLIIHRIFIAYYRMLFRDCRQQSSSYPLSTTPLLCIYSSTAVRTACGIVVRTATQPARSTLRTLGVQVLPLLLTVGFFPPVSFLPEGVPSAFPCAAGLI